MIITKLVNVLNSIGIILQEVKYMIYNEQNQQMEMTPTDEQKQAVITLRKSLRAYIQDEGILEELETQLKEVVKQSMRTGYLNWMELARMTQKGEMRKTR